MLNKAEGARLEQTEGLIALIKFLRTQIDCFSMPVGEALSRCPREVLDRCVSVGGRLSSAEELCEKLKTNDRQTRCIMEQLCRQIGRGYRAEQLALCDGICEQLEQRRGALAQQLPLKKKRNSTLCVSGALVLVILFL